MATLFPRKDPIWKAFLAERTRRKHIELNTKYFRETYRRYNFFLNKETEKEYIDWMEAQPSYKGALIRLISEEMEREKAKQ